MSEKVMSGKELLGRIVAVAGIVAAVYALFEYVLPFVLPFLLGYIIAGWLEPIVKKFVKKTGLPYKIGGTIIFLIIFGVILSVIVIIVTVLAGQLRNMISGIPFIREQARDSVQSICTYCDGWFGIKSGSMYNIVQVSSEYIGNSFMKNVVPVVTKSAWNVCLWTGSAAILVAFVILSTWMIIEDYESIHSKINNTGVVRELFPVIEQVKYTVGAYLKTQGIIILIIMAICSVVLYIIGNPYGLLIGLLIAIVDSLPVLGSGSILIPWAIIRFVQGAYVESGVLVVLYLVCLIVREILEPRIMGRRTGISPVYMLASFYIGIKLYGVTGVILGPVGMVIIFSLCRQFIKE